MKTLAAWIVGIFALGLALGSFVSGSSESTEAELSELENALDTAPVVDCGPGREALLEPVVVDERTSFKVRCVPTEQEERKVAASPRAVPIGTAPEPAPAPAPSEPVDHDPSESVADEADIDRDDSRTWKESAVIIGGSAGAGAGIGAIAKGKKGAAVGAAIGAATATAYELITRDNKKN